MTNNTKRTKVAQMTLLAMLVAILVVLAYVNIPMPMGLSITFNMIPVAIAAIAMGLPGGMIVGGAFGLISFLQCFGIFGSSPLGAALVNISPVLMFIQRFVSRLLVLFFGHSEKLAGPIAEKGVLMYIITSVGINAVVEMAVAALVTGAACAALKKARLL